MYDSPPYWEHGVFLQPQHFQLEHLQMLRRTTQSLALTNPWLWGIRRLAINEDALTNDIFEIISLELLLPSGEWALVPGNGVVRHKGFRAVWTNPETPLPVYLGIAPLREQGNNVIRIAQQEDAPEMFRFLSPHEPEAIPDLYGDGPGVELATLRYNLRLCFGPDEGKDIWRMPLARLMRDGERVLLDQRFAPPCVDINAVPGLQRIVRDVRDTLLSRSMQLAEYKIIAGDADASGMNSLHGITLFSILGVLSRNTPEMEHVLTAPSIHPWPVYRSLCRLVGELSVFSASLSPLGETPQGTRALPAYAHEQLFDCFSAAYNIISRLVDTLVVGPAYTFLLEPLADNDLALGVVMPQSARSNNYGYWLLLRSGALEELAEHVQTLGKLAPSSDMKGIVAQALPGIRLRHAEQPPAGLPRRNDTLYFMIDQNDPLWQKVMQTGDVAFALPNRPADMLAQLMIIQR